MQGLKTVRPFYHAYFSLSKYFTSCKLLINKDDNIHNQRSTKNRRWEYLQVDLRVFIKIKNRFIGYTKPYFILYDDDGQSKIQIKMHITMGKIILILISQKSWIKKRYEEIVWNIVKPDEYSLLSKLELNES